MFDCLDTRTRLLFFSCLKDTAGARAALKNTAPAPGSDQQKNRLRLRNTANTVLSANNFLLRQESVYSCYNQCADCNNRTLIPYVMQQQDTSRVRTATIGHYTGQVVQGLWRVGGAGQVVQGLWRGWGQVVQQ